MASTPSTKLKKVKLIISGQPLIRTSWISIPGLNHQHISIADCPSGLIHDITLFIDTKVTELIECFVDV